MGESRTELLAWLNDLLQINYTRVEQAGTGGAYCQVMDSIYGDVHMNKVKFDTKHEYEYVANYKVLQHTFDKHKTVPVEKLMKCKFQDNLEFLQWLKRFWDLNFPGGSYDALGRRKGSSAAPPTARAGMSGRGTVAAGAAARTQRPAARATSTTSGRLSASSGSSKTDQHHSSSAIIELNKHIAELKMSVDGLEKERDFYFGKLRDIEILVQEELDASVQHQPVLKEIQAILYSTEEGFELPPENELLDHHHYEDEDVF
ncbi:EB1 domain-containing protein [Dichotomocladium elegans]|nr:EB1 domain-containing protein [Dichotomocladium elegans]